MSVSAASGKSMEADINSDDSFVYIYRVAGLLQDRLGTYPYTFTYIGLAIRLLQCIGYVLNPLYTYNFMFMKQMAFFIFIFSGPLFDRSYGPMSIVAYISILVVVVVTLVVGGIFFVVNCIKPAWQEHTHLLRFIRVVIESVSGWFYVPMMHLCLGALPCSSGNVRNFPDTKCGSAPHIVCYVFGVIGILGSVALAAIGCLLFNPDPHSNHLLARAHGYVDFIMLVTNTVALIFFHILLDAGYDTSYSIIMMAIAVIWLAAMLFILPYYNITVVSLYSGTFLTTLVVAFVNCLTAYNVSFLSAGTPVLQCTIVFSIIPAVFIVGYLLGPIRVSSDFTSKLHKLHFYGYTPEHVALFPFPRTFKSNNHAVAPQSMLAVHMDLRCEINMEDRDEAEAEEKDQLEEAHRHRFEFFVPYISNAYISTDSEVATRFLRNFRIKTGGVKKYTASQLLYTLNMYFKALGYFKQSSYVLVSMGWFLLSYCNREGAVLELVNHIHSRTNFNADYMVGFKFFRLEYIVKESLGYRGAIYILALQRAHLFHRQALTTMVRFWVGLQRGDSPTQMLVTADELARLRRTAFHEYHLALTTNKDDRNALNYLASFIEDLLHQKDIANGLRSAISEMELEKKNRAILSAHRTQGMSTEKTEIEFRAVSKACDNDQTIRLTRHGNERCFFFMFSYYSVCGCLALLAGMLAVFIVGVKIAHRDADAISDIYRVKASGFSAMYNTEAIALYSIEHNCADSAGTCVSDLKFVQILQEISSSEQEMRIRQNRIAFGSNSLGYSSTAFDFAAKGLLPLRFYTVGKTLFEGLFSSNARGLVSVYAKLTSYLVSKSTPQVQWLTSPTASAYITTMLNSIQKSQPYTHYMQFVTDGGLDVYLSAMDPYAAAVKSDISSKVTTLYTLLSVLFVLSLIHLVLIILAHYAITAWSTKNRIMLINLFQKVPQAAVEDLRVQHAQILSSFRVAGENVKRDDEFVEEEEEAEDEDKNSDKAAANMTAFRSALVTVLQSKPLKSCMKQPGSYAPNRRVWFRLTQHDLAEIPRRKLNEPEISIKGSRTKIVEDFEKSLEEIEQEVIRERALEQQRRDTYTEHMVTSGYRYQWRRIKERIASWGNSDSLPLFIAGAVVALILIGLAAAVLGLLTSTLDLSGGSFSFEQSSIKQLELVYSYVAAFDKADIYTSVFCNFFYPEYAKMFSAYSFEEQGYNSLSNSLQKVYDSDLLELTPYSEDLTTAVLRPSLSNMMYVALCARAGMGLNEYDLSSSAFINTFTWGDQESDVVYLSETYPQAFDQPDEYTIPTLKSLPDVAADFYKEVLPLHRRQRFFEDVDAIRTALSYGGEKVKDTSISNVNKRNDQTQNYIAISLGFCAVITVGVFVSVILAFLKDFGLMPKIYLLVSLICTVGCFVLLIVSYKKQDDGTAYISQIQGTLENISQFRTNFYRRVVEIEQYFHNSNPNYIKSILQYRPELIQFYFNSVVECFPSMKSQVNAILQGDNQMWTIQQVSLFLFAAQAKKAANPTAAVADLYPRSPPFISTYNYKEEPNYATDQSQYGNDPKAKLYMYSTPEEDLKKSAEELFDMARFAVFGLRGASYFFDTFQLIESLIQNIVEVSGEKLQSIDKKERVLNIIAVVLIAISLTALVGAALTPIVRFLRSLAEGPNASLVREAMRVSESIMKMPKIIALGIVFAVIVILFYIFAMIPIDGLLYMSEVTRYSGARLASIHRTMAKAQYVVHSLNSNSPCLAFTAIVTMQPDYDILDKARTFLYFSSASAKSGLGKIKTFSSAQRSLLFTASDGGDTVDTMYRNWMSVINDIINLTPESYVPTPDANTPMKNVYAVTQAQINEIAGWISSLEKDYSTLVNTLQSSDDDYVSNIQKALGKSIAPAVAFYALITFSLLLAALVILPALSMQEKRSEEDIRPILAAIPKAVIDSVPALSLFADSGIIDDSSDNATAGCALSLAALQFVELWRTLDESELESGYAELENNPNACILSTETGVIVAANGAALAMFKHDSLSGKEVSILMDQGAAEMHSRMMAYYVEHRGTKQDGPAKVDVQAYTKNMESIHVVIVLAEAVLKNDRLFFLAEIYPSSQSRIITK